MANLIRVFAVGVGDDARSVPLLDPDGRGTVVRNGRRFVARDAAGLPFPDGELVPALTDYVRALACGDLTTAAAED